MSNNEISHVFISGGSKGLGGHLYEQLRIQKNMTITVIGRSKPNNMRNNDFFHAKRFCK